MNIPKGKFSKIILIGEDLFLNSGFSLGIYVLISKIIGGECVPSASVLPACLGLD